MTDTFPSVLRPSVAARRLGVHKRTLERWARDGKFPPKIQLGPRSVGYSEQAVAAFLASRARSDGSQP